MRAALYGIHDIFFVMDAAERMSILHHDREVRKEKMLRQMVCYMIFKLVNDEKHIYFFYTHKILLIADMWVFLPHQISDTSWVSTIQFSSDTIYLESVSDATR